MVAVAGVPLSGVFVVNGTPSSRFLEVTGIPPLRSPVIRLLPTPLLGSQVQGWGLVIRFLPVTNNVPVGTWSTQSISLFICGKELEMFDSGFVFSSAKVRERTLDGFSTTRTFWSGSKVGENTLHLFGVTLCFSWLCMLITDDLNSENPNSFPSHWRHMLEGSPSSSLMDTCNSSDMVFARFFLIPLLLKTLVERSISFSLPQSLQYFAPKLEYFF